MISIQNFSLRVGARELVHNTSSHIDKDMHIGFVGCNGAGKTATIRLLVGEADYGATEHEEAIIPNGALDYLMQDAHVRNQLTTVQERIISACGIDQIITRIRKAEHGMASTMGTRQQEVMECYVCLDQEFTAQGGWAVNAKAAQITHSLGFEDRILEQILDTFSGRQRRRVGLARVLFSGTGALLLDEPTNHLDHDSIIWPCGWIKTSPGGVIMISRDAKLPGGIVNQVFYPNAMRAEADIYHLGWSIYLKQRRRDERHCHKERINVVKKAERLFTQGERMRTKVTKAVVTQQMLRRTEELPIQASAETMQGEVVRLRFSNPSPLGWVPLVTEDLSKSYGSLGVFTGMDLATDRGTKAVILGLNGAGRTTLPRLLSGIEEPDMGGVIPGHGFKLGCYVQEHETLDDVASVRDNMAHAAPELDKTYLRNILDQSLLPGDDVNKSVSVLSGKEKTWLTLATFVVSEANVFLLDEPTNNLDPASREEILSALDSYKNAVALVTHDPSAVLAPYSDRVLPLPDADEGLRDGSYLDLVMLT